MALEPMSRRAGTTRTSISRSWRKHCVARSWKPRQPTLNGAITPRSTCSLMRVPANESTTRLLRRSNAERALGDPALSATEFGRHGVGTRTLQNAHKGRAVGGLDYLNRAAHGETTEVCIAQQPTRHQRIRLTGRERHRLISHGSRLHDRRWRTGAGYDHREGGGENQFHTRILRPTRPERRTFALRNG